MSDKCLNGASPPSSASNVTQRLNGWVFVSSFCFKEFFKIPLRKYWLFFVDDYHVCFSSRPTVSEAHACKKISIKNCLVSFFGKNNLNNQLSQEQLSHVSGNFFTFCIECLDNDLSNVCLPTAPSLGLVLVINGERDLEEVWRILFKCASLQYTNRDRKRDRIRRKISRFLMKISGDLKSLDVAGNTNSSDYEDLVQRRDNNITTAISTEFHSLPDEDDFFRSPPTSPAVIVSSEFVSFQEMRNSSEFARHSTPPSSAELESMLSYIRSIKEGDKGNSSSFTQVEGNDDEDDDDERWTECTNKDGVVTLKCVDTERGIIQAKTIGKIPGVPPQVVFNHVYDTKMRLSWDKHFYKFETQKDARKDISIEECTDIIFACVHGLLTAADREFLEWRRYRLPDKIHSPRSGDFSIYLRSCEYPGSPPVGRGNVRAEVWTSGYVVSWDEDCKGSIILVYSQVDIRGKIPKTLINLFAPTTALKWLRGLREACRKFVEREGVSLASSDEELDRLVLVPFWPSNKDAQEIVSNNH